MIEERKGWFFISTRHSSYIMRISPTGHIEHIHYGGYIPSSSEGIGQIQGPDDIRLGDGTYYDEDHQHTFLSRMLQEYSVPGKGDTRESALIAEYRNGLITLDFIYHSHRIYSGKDYAILPKVSGNGAETLELTLCDTVLPVYLILRYTSYEEEDVILRSAEIRNEMDDEVLLRTVSSMMLDLPDSEWDLMTFDGAWARERNEHRRPLAPGVVYVDSKLGFSSCEHNSLVFLLRPDADDSHGEAIAINQIYSGNHQERVEVSPFGLVRVIASINPFGFGWKLGKGESFRSPEAVLSYSCSGLDKLSASLHRFAERYIVRSRYGQMDRPIAINNWEATYFDFTEEKIMKLAATAASVGIELFVLDDGWFGRRTNDTRGLGDWTVNRSKLPEGLSGYADKIHSLGMKAGIWVEPEMVSMDSELYEKHPEWMIAIPGRRPSAGRHQYILDLSRADVIEYLFQSMSSVFSSGIDYVKWDANRNMSDYFTSSPDARFQGELFHRYIQGLYSLLDRLTSAFPDILFEFCSSGGNRYDLGALAFSPQGWVSDDTDAMERMRIQNGTLRGYPLSSMSNHVTASPNHQNLRRTGLEDRFGVACFGVLGYELDLNKLSDEELSVIKNQIAFYKAHRHTFQHGTFHHLPSSDGALFWAVESSDEMIILEYQERNGVNTGRHRRLRIPFADRDTVYSIERRGKHVFREDLGDLWKDYESVLHEPFSIRVSGAVLAEAGIALPPLFMGRGFEPATRVLMDNGADLYVVRKT